VLAATASASLGVRACKSMDRNPDETARKIAEEALRRLAAELETGRSEALTNYLAVMSRLRTQSWSNVLLIAAQRPDATRVAGFHTWNTLGRAVKKGEKGIVIFAPVSGQQEPTRSQASHKDNAFRPPGSRAAYVFDVSQTEGKPLPECAQTSEDVWKYGEQLRALVARRGIELQIDRRIEPARGISSGGNIRLKRGSPRPNGSPFSRTSWPMKCFTTARRPQPCPATSSRRRRMVWPMSSRAAWA